MLALTFIARHAPLHHQQQQQQQFGWLFTLAQPAAYN